MSAWFDGDYAALCEDEADGYRKLGESCASEQGAFFWIDNCAKGLECFASTCVPMCAGGPGSVYCDDPNLECAYSIGDGPQECVFSVCLEPCDPTGPDCNPDSVCDVYAGAFYCATHYLSLPEHAATCGPGDCEPGLFCDAYLPEDAGYCDGDTDEPGGPCEDRYCQRYCSLDELDSCPAAYGNQQECVPWYGSATPPEGHENLGRCRIIEN